MLRLSRFLNIRLVLTLSLLVIIATVFWSQSRYPSLDEKAVMSGAIQLEDPMSFEAMLPVETHFPLWQKIIYTTLNWINTNIEGMLFGILFGSGFLTLLRYVGKRNFKSGFMNALLGLAIGAPMGVCVNCAAPVAKGLYSGGARAETTLSAMIASPTFNIVVLTMAFSLLPFYLVVAKIALSLAVIMIAIPLICRFLPSEQLQISDAEIINCPIPQKLMDSEIETFLQAILGVARDYLTDLWYIIKMSVPLMLLAGFLGAVLITLLPLEILQNLDYGVLGLIFAALIGTVLPVPIAFDVVVTSALLNGGLAAGYVMVLLFTLGSFSIYSYLIVATSISWRAASILGGVIVALGIVAGVGADTYHKWQTKRALEILSGFSPISHAHAEQVQPSLTFLEKDHRITVTSRAFNMRSPASEKPFSRIEAWHLGIDKPIEFSFKDMWPPFWEGRSISSGDFDKDGDADLILASSERGLYVYANDGNGQFTPKQFFLEAIAELPIFNAVLVDINNDSWMDLFVTTYANGNFILWNNEGSFGSKNMTSVANRDDAKLILAAAFGDVDQDGDIDVALGNWTAGWYRRVPGEESRNRIIYNEDGQMTGEKFKDLSGMPGETLSMLLSDMNMDGNLDLLVGNDFEQPDIFYFGDGYDKFNSVHRNDEIIPATTTTTMSVKNADLNNDGKPEIYLAQIAGRSSGVSETLKMQDIALYCSGIERDEGRQTCQKNIDIKTWYKAGNQFDPTFAHKCLEMEGNYQAECKAMLVKDLAIQNDDPSICELISPNQKIIQQFCSTHFLEVEKPTQEKYLENVAQIKRRNVLLMRQEDGKYIDETVERGLDVGGWSWDVKIADFDNDEWQDVYIVNGTWVPNEVTPSNLYYSNLGDGKFEEMSGPFGLEDYLITAAATTVDLDNDGDLDMVSVPVNGPITAFMNNTQSGNSVRFEFSDHVGNHFGIGNRVDIFYGDNGNRKQMREIQLGGGFMSFDAPSAHFGLGSHEEIEKVIIHWSDGEMSILEGPFASEQIYQVERQKLAAQ